MNRLEYLQLKDHCMDLTIEEMEEMIKLEKEEQDNA